MKKEKKHVSSDVDRVLFALKKAVMFFEQSGNNLNLDAYFGLRIAQGWYTFLYILPSYLFNIVL